MTRMKAGTRMPRTIVASMRTASAIAKPSDLMTITDDSAKAPKTGDHDQGRAGDDPAGDADALGDRRVLSPVAR